MSLSQLPLTSPSLQSMIKLPMHENLIGQSPLIREVNETIRRLALSNLTVLVTGESGTGKDIAAHLLHRLSPRYGKPFIKVNCPAIPEGILESELFGYERGAFTGARTSKPGRFELANHGTIFLDEIAETSYTVQGKLLQVLEGEAFMRIGGVTPVKTDVRIVAATNVNLEDAVKQKRLREDIYFRLSEVIVRMPSLRDRTEDVPLLAEHFNFNFSKKLGREYEPIPAESLARMQELPWNGNVRELAGVIKKFVTTRNAAVLLEVQEQPNRLTAVHSQPASTSAPRSATPANPPVPPVSNARKSVSLKEATRLAVEKTERELITQTLKATLWNRRKAAKLLDISYSSLLRRIDAYGIGKADFE
jgi:two-component system response regulator AtoC